MFKPLPTQIFFLNPLGCKLFCCRKCHYLCIFIREWETWFHYLTRFCGFLSDLSRFVSCWLSLWGCKKQRPALFLPVVMSSAVASLVTICPNRQKHGASSCNDMCYATGWIKVSHRMQLHYFLACSSTLFPLILPQFYACRVKVCGSWAECKGLIHPV